MKKLRKKQRQGIWFIILLALAIAFVGLRPQSIFQPGAEAPLTVDLSVEDTQLIQGQDLRATADMQLFNRNASTAGGHLVALAWFVDGKMVEWCSGGTQSVSTEHETGTYPDVGRIGYERWQWTTLPYVFQMPPQNNTVSASRDLQFDTLQLSKGQHQLSLKAMLLCGSSDASNVFQCGTVNGACCPLQTASQGFPCGGIYGQTEVFWRSQENVCASAGSGFLSCGSKTDCLACRDYCCQKQWCGAGWCGSTAPGECFLGNIIKCGVSPKTYFLDWESKVEEQVSEEQARANALGSAFTVAAAYFEVVEECGQECCVGVAGVQDKFCPDGYVCQAGGCVFVVEPCPFDCCQGNPKYYDKGCPVGFNCVGTDCVEAPPHTVCGNKVCELGEDEVNCPADCAVSICGDGVCQANESVESCPEDCVVTECGDGFCGAGETVENCPQDCAEGVDWAFIAGVFLLLAAVALVAWKVVKK